jgi:transposase InsO family protein
MCSLLEVSRSAYYAWASGVSHQPTEADVKLACEVSELFWTHKRRYGSRRIQKDLHNKDLIVSRNTVADIMRDQELKAIQPRSFVPRTTDSRHRYHVNDNLLEGLGKPQRPNQVWVGDITYIPMAGGGWTYLSVWMDLYSRVIVGWSHDVHMKESLVIKSLKNALKLRKIRDELIIHTDRGGQYGGGGFRAMLGSNIRQSMSRADNPYDNAFMESFFSRLKTELIGKHQFLTVEDARSSIFEYIEMYYNTKRIHSSLGYKSPMQYEKEHYSKEKK